MHVWMELHIHLFIILSSTTLGSDCNDERMQHIYVHIGWYVHTQYILNAMQNGNAHINNLLNVLNVM